MHLRGGLVVAAMAGCAVVTVMACVGDDPIPPTGTAAGDAGSASSSTGGSTSGVGSTSGGGIHCNGVTCATLEVCCVETSNGDFKSATCKAQSDCATDYLACDDSHDCANGKVCCVNTNGGSAVWPSASCRDACVGSQKQLCASESECDGGCVPAQSYVHPSGLRRCE